VVHAGGDVQDQGQAHWRWSVVGTYAGAASSSSLANGIMVVETVAGRPLVPDSGSTA
jgi:hypothetical protein